MTILWIAVFGALGSLSRFAVSLWLAPRTSAEFPWSTVLVNLFGCLVIGVLIGSGLLDNPKYPFLRAAAVTGFLGAFTTFSAFSAETWLLVEAGRTVPAILYVTTTIIGCLMLTAVGYSVARIGGQ